MRCALNTHLKSLVTVTSAVTTATRVFSTASPVNCITGRAGVVASLATATVFCVQRRHMASNMSKQAPPSGTNCAQIHEKDGSKDCGDAVWREKLTPRQYNVLRLKATDPRGGPYDDFFGEGEYVCAGCGSLLYTSAMKFECGCGWPGFWDCVPKAVREETDADGYRTEILCNACNGHLGHVFRGEGFTNPPPNERHCVNNTSIQFIPKKA